MKIAMLGHKSIPSRSGGIEIVVEELGTRMVKLGNSVTAYSRKDSVGSGRIQKKTENFKGMEIKEVLTVGAGGIAAVTSSFCACLRAGFGKYDIVHIHAEGPAFFCFIPKLCGKKTIVTIHGLDWKRAKWGKFASWYLKKGEMAAVKYADEIIVLNEATKEYFKEHYNRAVNYVPNGAYKPEMREVSEIKRYGLQKNGYILYLGRIVPEKGEHYLIEAFKGIETDKKLVIAGDITTANAYGKKLKELSSGNKNIVFTGFAKGRMLEELFSNAYLYCLPSDLEGMPISLLEAMSYGNCCLTSDIPECTEAMGDMGVTFRAGSVKDLREKLEWLINNEEIVENYKASSCDFILGRYNWDEVAEETLKIYGL